MKYLRPPLVGRCCDERWFRHSERKNQWLFQVFQYLRVFTKKSPNAPGTPSVPSSNGIASKGSVVNVFVRVAQKRLALPSPPRLAIPRDNQQFSFSIAVIKGLLREAVLFFKAAT